MKNSIIRFMIVIFSVFICSSLLSGSPVDKEVSFKVQKGDFLEVSIMQGNITVSTWDKGEIKIIARNIDEDETNLLTMEQKSSKVEVRFKGENSNRFLLELTIPAELNIDFSTGGGNITINNDLHGKTDISSGGGNIFTKNINGKADISTGGGNINIGDINGDADVSTAGGDIQIGTVNGMADISTAGGNIKVGSINSSADISTAGGNINVGTVGGRADISTAGGNINVGTISGSADVSSAGGNINLDGATGKVEASTGAGNLNLKNIQGSIEASTGAGNITAELSPDGKNKSELNSAVGNITLYIPESANATIVAIVSIMGWGISDNEDDNIKSEFKQSNINKNMEDRELEATYVLNGGGSRVELNVAMGKIIIKKLK